MLQSILNSIIGLLEFSFRKKKNVVQIFQTPFNFWQAQSNYVQLLTFEKQTCRVSVYVCTINHSG